MPLSQLEAASTADHVVPSEVYWNSVDPPAGTDASRSRRPVTNAPDTTETPDGSAALKVTTAAGAPVPPVAVIETALLSPPSPLRRTKRYVCWSVPAVVSTYDLVSGESSTSGVDVESRYRSYIAAPPNAGCCQVSAIPPGTLAALKDVGADGSALFTR